MDASTGPLQEPLPYLSRIGPPVTTKFRVGTWFAALAFFLAVFTEIASFLVQQLISSSSSYAASRIMIALVAAFCQWLLPWGVLLFGLLMMHGAIPPHRPCRVVFLLSGIAWSLLSLMVMALHLLLAPGLLTSTRFMTWFRPLSLVDFLAGGTMKVLCLASILALCARVAETLDRHALKHVAWILAASISLMQVTAWLLNLLFFSGWIFPAATPPAALWAHFAGLAMTRTPYLLIGIYLLVLARASKLSPPASQPAR